ncbi:glycoside hydrolase family 128 protein [Ceratobasidium sp. AG-Ba]|nr:glycoside hydrolase family 128 protein [Ceratobasidium sp. AG-Ba]
MAFTRSISFAAFSALVAVSQVLGAANPKRGLCFAEGDNPGDIKLANQTGTALTWTYNWGQSPPDYLKTANTKLTYIPMQWGRDGIANFASLVKAQGARTILTFNEPDFATQSNITATEAASLWKQYIQPLHASGIRLGAPAVTNAPSGRQWLSDFLKACTGCTIDFVPIHWYGSGVGAFYDYIWAIHGEFPSYPLWVTEFAETSSDDKVVANFMNATINYMDTLDWIERYSWFAFFRQETGSHYNLLNANGTLNTLGHMYIGK